MDVMRHQHPGIVEESNWPTEFILKSVVNYERGQQDYFVDNPAAL